MGTEELGLELYWDMERHIAGFRLNVMEKESPVQLWETSISILSSDTAINFPDLLKKFRGSVLLTLQNCSRQNEGYSGSCTCAL